MAINAVGNVGEIDIGKFLKIYSTNGVYNNLSEASEMWKFFLKLKAGATGGRQMKYLLRTSYGPAAVQSLDAGSLADFPDAQRSGLSEGTAEYKDYALTVSVPRNLLDKTGSDLLQYADPVTEEMDAKAIAAARIMSGQMHRDGSGVIGKAASSAFTATTVSITLSTASADAGRSHIGWFELEDRVKFADDDANAVQAPTTAQTIDYYVVKDIDEDTDTVTFEAVQTISGDPVTDIQGGVPAGTNIYRKGTTPNTLSGLTAGDEYNALSEELVGLESLTADDGRKVNNINLTGAVKGTRQAVTTSLDGSDFQTIMSKVKRKVGKGRYNYRNAFMYDTRYDELLANSETDRRFQTIDDGSRGFKKLGYQHGNDFIEFTSDEFCSKQRVWMLPESKDVLEFHGRDFELVEVNPGQKFHLATAGSGRGHSRENLAYMEGSAVICCKHPAAVACLEIS